MTGRVGLEALASAPLWTALGSRGLTESARARTGQGLGQPNGAARSRTVPRPSATHQPPVQGTTLSVVWNRSDGQDGEDFLFAQDEVRLALARALYEVRSASSSGLVYRPCDGRNFKAIYEDGLLIERLNLQQPTSPL